MSKIVYNNCFGGFGLSDKACERYFELKGWKWKKKDRHTFEVEGKFWYDGDLERDDLVLVQVVEELGSNEASGNCASLQIRDIPSGQPYRIDEYDGNERIETPDSYEWKTAK